MPSRPKSIEDILGEKGALAGSFEDFEFRPVQVEMASLIGKAITNRCQAVIEAGTGTGKTMAYLVPLILGGKKTVISTATKTLQEQIFFKDIPLLCRTTGLKVEALLMKGRKNYLCLHRYHQHFSFPPVAGTAEHRIKQRLEKWLKETEFGDRAELQWLADEDPLWDYVSSSSDQCLGSDCLYREDCFLNVLRKRAARADLIIVNHHLFFADIMVKKVGFGEIIPRFQVAVFDEAHKIEEIATTYFGASLSTGQVADIVKDVERELERSDHHDRKDVQKRLNVIRSRMEQIQNHFYQSEEKAMLKGDIMMKIHEGPSADIRNELDYIRQRFSQALSARADGLGQALETIFSYNDPERLNWYEKRTRGMTFHSSPLNISRDMSELLYDRVKTIVFTSATLSTNGRFDYIRSRLGIPETALEGIYPPHFDFKKQALLYVPRDLPVPGAVDFAFEAAREIMNILRITFGRALVLFTSYLNLDIVHRLIKGNMPYAVYRQGEAPRSILLKKFRQETHSVLLATGSFWQGVDVPGESLTCLIVDKLPFDSPGNPLVAARIESIRSRGGNPFMEYQLPSAIISLKQGLGRLIRKSSDRGILAVLDVRILTSSYGQFFFQSLPELTVSRDLEDMRSFLHDHRYPLN